MKKSQIIIIDSNISIPKEPLRTMVLPYNVFIQYVEGSIHYFGDSIPSFWHFYQLILSCI
ncbi:hypothetical protein [Lysinibacillus pakistanensis]|uniref:hypothetical protein n=1 Tax=Lysinibacillus pakistanensis TaxID=759811 RepID=UPI003D28E9A3